MVGAARLPVMAKLRGAIGPADLAGKGIAAQPDITVRSGIVVGDLDGLRHYLRSLNPFEITFGRVSFFPASVNSANAAVLKVDVISPLLQEIHLAMEQHANCKPSDSDYQPQAIVAYVKPKAVKKYVGNETLPPPRLQGSPRWSGRRPKVTPQRGAGRPGGGGCPHTATGAREVRGRRTS